MEAISYKCPCCDAPLEFSSNTQKMKCEYCNNEFTIEQAKEYANFENQTKSDSNYDWNTENEQGEEEIPGMHAFVCSSCGGEIVCDENTIATECVYCGNQTVMPKRAEGILKPDLVVPFMIDKKEAKRLLTEFYKNKPLLPKFFLGDNVLEKVTGMYVPFWLYDCDAEGAVVYNATRISTWSDSKYDYTKTDHYNCFRQGTMSFRDIPADGSKKMPDEYMDSIEPFDLSQGVDFDTAYLSGYLADKYDVSARDNLPRVNERVNTSVDEVFRDTVNGFATVSVKNSTINSSNPKIKYALLPVWILNTKYKGESHMFTINGQTGKIAGQLPIDYKRYWLKFAICAGIITAIASIIASFILM